METFHVAIASDENYAILGAMALYSLHLHLNPKAHVTAHIIDTGITRKSKKKFERIFKLSNFTLNWLTPKSENLKNLPTSSWVSAAGNMRVLLPEILPENADRVLYLDCDMIVLEDISTLWNLNINEATLFACIDSKYSKVEKCKAKNALLDNGLLIDDPYFNSGLLLIHKQKWIKNKVKQKYIDLLNEQGQMFTHLNQDTLNIILRDDWITLHPKWNVINISEYSSSFNASPAIVHYAGTNFFDPFDKHPYKKIFLHLLKKSGWFNKKEFFVWKIKNATYSVSKYVSSLNGKFGIRTILKSALSK